MIFKINTLFLIFLLALSLFSILNYFTFTKTKKWNYIFLGKDIGLMVLSIITYSIFEFVLEDQYKNGLFIPSELNYYILFTLLAIQVGFIIFWYFDFKFNLKQNILSIVCLSLSIVFVILDTILSQVYLNSNISFNTFMICFYVSVSILIVLLLSQTIINEIIRFKNNNSVKREVRMIIKASLTFISTVLQIIILISAVLYSKDNSKGKIFSDWLNYGYLLGIIMLWYPTILFQSINLFVYLEDNKTEKKEVVENLN
ncbi:hypothetical protein SCHIN_v1c03590 [Spiroplasma chinense]|uniref:Uncharacterized protein n=1 Tax=Spiroplasma chinense TaxID=216932 RepID=A0A5B9Y4F2_9MOLU|nr:hypothetical protein [Spiroplasma chinense]QEH61556.1 hypothetical protein SCHIN_v1c03590 [Spiroplasma chinense]